MTNTFIIEVAEGGLYFKRHEENLAFTVTPYKDQAMVLTGVQFAEHHLSVLQKCYPGIRFALIEVLTPSIGGLALGK